MANHVAFPPSGACETTIDNARRRRFDNPRDHATAIGYAVAKAEAGVSRAKSAPATAIGGKLVAPSWLAD